MSVITVIEKMTTIQAQLKELASEVENIQISFDGQTTPNAPPKLENKLPGNFVGAVLAQEEYTIELISHLQSKINFLANSLYPNSKGAALSAEAARAMAAKLATRIGIGAAPEAQLGGKISSALIDDNGKVSNAQSL